MQDLGLDPLSGTISSQFGVLGHSDGAGAAHSVIPAIQALADPSLELVGTAPFADVGSSARPFVEVSGNVYQDYESKEYLWPYIVYIAKGIENFANVKLGIPFDKSTMLAPDFYQFVEQEDAWDQCWDLLFESTMGSQNFDEYLTANWDQLPAVQAWLDDTVVDTTYW